MMEVVSNYNNHNCFMGVSVSLYVMVVCVWNCLSMCEHEQVDLKLLFFYPFPSSLFSKMAWNTVEIASCMLFPFIVLFMGAFMCFAF